MRDRSLFTGNDPWRIQQIGANRPSPSKWVVILNQFGLATTIFLVVVHDLIQPPTGKTMTVSYYTQPMQPVPPQPTAQKKRSKLPIILWAIATPVLMLAACGTGGAMLAGETIEVPGDTVTVAGPVTTVTEAAKPGDAKTVTAKPKPAATKTVEKKVPGPTVTVTEPAPDGPGPGDDTENDEDDGEPQGGGAGVGGQVIGDGSWLIGSKADISPGRYRTIGNAEDFGSLCYADVQTDSGDYLAQELTSSGRTIVNIKAAGDVFTSRSCGEWERV